MTEPDQIDARELLKLLKRVHQILTEQEEQRRRSEEVIDIARRAVRLMVTILMVVAAVSIIADVLDLALALRR